MKGAMTRAAMRFLAASLAALRSCRGRTAESRAEEFCAHRRAGADRLPGGAKPDLAFGAFQRGYFLTAFSMARTAPPSTTMPRR